MTRKKVGGRARTREGPPGAIGSSNEALETIAAAAIE
jgi:hypothetical protein